eukprot:EG_transcript_36883
MSAPPNLILNVQFNPPVVKVIGPIQEETIQRLNAALPLSCTTDPRGRAPPAQFQYTEQPLPHWSMHLYGNYCNEQGKMQVMLDLLDALEEEGGWRLKAANGLPQIECETHKFFFVQKQ